MSAPSDSQAESPSAAPLRLAGERIIFVGRLAGMVRAEASALVREHGGAILSDANLSDGNFNEASEAATLAVLGDNQPDLASALQSKKLAHQRLAADVAAGVTKLLRESELWQRLGLIDEGGLVGEEGLASEEAHGVQRLYTPAMLSELLDVPVAAIRRWHRRGTLVACRSVRRLPYFDFTEVAVARHLAALLNAGCSLTVIDRKLTELHRSLPAVQRPLCDPAVVVAGRQLILRRGEDLTELGGQLLIDFDKPDATDEQPEEVLLSVGAGLQTVETESSETLSTFEQLQFEALKWEDQGELQRAVETYRTLLMAGGPTAEVHFALADLLYRMGDLPAARERFYAAIELDEEYVEARANLGCVLAENGELELAVAAFQGALAFHRDYADVHYHLASALDRLQRAEESELHWQTFLALAPESPWAETARARLGLAEEEPLTVVGPPC